MSLLLEDPPVRESFDVAEMPVVDPNAKAGIRRMTAREARIQRRSVLAITILPLLGFVAAAVGLWGTKLHWSDVVAFAVMYVVSGLGITVGFHRLLTHASFETPRWVRTAWAIAGTFAVEGPVLTWVADHRRHHAFSDQPGDPHSPHLTEGDGLRAMLGGLWHAHVGWLFKTHESDQERWIKDLLADRQLRAVDRAFPLLVALTFIIPGLIGFAIDDSLAAFVSGALWGGLARMFLLQHVTWSINSICHFYGSRPYETTDESTNNWLLAIPSFGESWHNAHHAFPSSAVHGLGRWEIDISALVIRGMELLRLARNVRTPSAGALERRRANAL